MDQGTNGYALLEVKNSNKELPKYQLPPSAQSPHDVSFTEVKTSFQLDKQHFVIQVIGTLPWKEGNLRPGHEEEDLHTHINSVSINTKSLFNYL
jgi:hypothetical protein